MCGPWFDVLPNVWLGASVEDDRVLGRLDDLRARAGVVRFVSFEPLIGSVAAGDLTGIHWAIVGGESGPRSRFMKPRVGARKSKLCARKSSTTFFFQTMGWEEQESGRSTAQWPHL